MSNSNRISPPPLMDVEMEDPQPAFASTSRSLLPLLAPPIAPRASSVPLRHSDFTAGFVYSAEMTSHFSPHGHPEAPERISRIWLAIVEAHFNKKMKWIPIRPVHKQEALLVHSEDHWDKVNAIQRKFFKCLRSSSD